MLILGLIVLFFTFSLYAPCIVAVTNSSITVPVNDNVLELNYSSYTKRERRWIPTPAPIVQSLFSVQDNSPYLAHVIVGGQLLYLAVQTSSATTWVASSQFTCLDSDNYPLKKPECKLGNLFNPTISQTFSQTSQVSTQHYLDGQFVHGIFVQEQLAFGGLTMDSKILLAENGHWEGDGISSGVLGLALKDQLGQKGIFHQVHLKNPDIQLAMVSLALYRFSPEVQPLGGEAGVLGIGGIPPDISTDDYWDTTPILDPLPGHAPRVRVKGFALRRLGQTHSVTGFRNRDAIMEIDYTSSKILLPADIVYSFSRLFEPAAQFDERKKVYFVKCSADAPSLGIRFSHYLYYVSGEDLLSPAPEYKKKEDEEKMCVLQVQPASGDTLVLGIPWLRSVVIAFDYSNTVLIRSKNGALRVAGRVETI
ncbi:aspartic peptidase domain-containing protein [Ampelomyces quisqualis]|uniref:Aspartic peptidase domain-containing protein n=1 Tax=Ampelomyces quisqualis TaxID=50730 RepID=A0A6A5QJM0_AMPQU|nr:aspartic peptidase domain-containing protein [Ampelomyces quisqualis]